jgi:peroxiredoxin
MKPGKLLLIISFLLIQNYLNAQWLPAERLTNNPAESYSYGKALCTHGNSVYAVWTDKRTGDYEIFFIRSLNKGSSWLTNQQLTVSAGISDLASIAVSDQYLHIAWMDTRAGDYGIYYKRSTSYGTGWETDTRLSSYPSSSNCPVIAVSGTNIYVFYHSYRNEKYDIYYKKSVNNGIDWGAETKLTTGLIMSMYPTVAVDAQYIMVAWQDFRDGNWEIYFSRSANGGASWSLDTRITSNTAASWGPSIAVQIPYVQLVWVDERNGNKEIYQQRSVFAGSSWLPAVRLTNNSASSQYPQVTLSDALVHVVWTDTRDNNSEIYYKLSTNYGQSWGVDTRLTNYPGISDVPSVNAIGLYVHVVWCDNHDGNYEIYYKQNPTGNSIGINKISTEVPVEFSLSQNYPNPFNPATKIRFEVPENTFVRIRVFNVLGNESGVLVNEKLSSGIYEVEFNADNLPSGVYFCKMEAGNFNNAKKMLLIK